MSIRVSSLTAWLAEMKVLEQVSSYYAVGFVRYENALVSLRNKGKRKSIHSFVAQSNITRLQLLLNASGLPVLHTEAATGLSTITSTSTSTNISTTSASAEHEDLHSNGDNIGFSGMHSGSKGSDTSRIDQKVFRNRVTWETTLDNLQLLSARANEKHVSWTHSAAVSPNAAASCTHRVVTLRRSVEHILNTSSNSCLWMKGVPENRYLTYTPSSFYPLKGIGQSSTYSAVTILTRAQVTSLEQRCHYLSRQTVYADKPVLSVRELFVSNQIYNCGPLESVFGSYVFDLYSSELACCMIWLLPVPHMDAFFIQHIGTPGVSQDNKWSNKQRLVGSADIESWHAYVNSLLAAEKQQQH
jgi:hypothetical protein